MARDLPESIDRQRELWWRAWFIWQTWHYTLGGLGAVSGAVVAVSSQIPGMVRWVPFLGLLSAITSGLLLFLNANKQATGFMKAYRRLNTACVRFVSDETYPLQNLLKIHEEGVTIIERSED
ncbi:MAG: hypothetical protein V1809_00290 [Planctomycetota bacterium]